MHFSPSREKASIIVKRSWLPALCSPCPESPGWSPAGWAGSANCSVCDPESLSVAPWLAPSPVGWVSPEACNPSNKSQKSRKSPFKLSRCHCIIPSPGQPREDCDDMSLLPVTGPLLRQARSAPPPWCSAGKITHVLFSCIWSVTSITFQALARMLLREIRVPGFQRHSKEETELFVSKEEWFWQKGQDGEEERREPPQEKSDLGTWWKYFHGEWLEFDEILATSLHCYKQSRSSCFLSPAPSWDHNPNSIHRGLG